MPQTANPGTTRKNAKPSDSAKSTPIPDTQRTEPNEGEGSRTAAKRYDEEAEAYVREGKVDQAANAAKSALEGPERESLERAEKEGKAKASNVEREGDLRGLDGEKEAPEDEDEDG